MTEVVNDRQAQMRSRSSGLCRVHVTGCRPAHTHRISGTDHIQGFDQRTVFFALVCIHVNRRPAALSAVIKFQTASFPHALYFLDGAVSATLVR